MKQSRYFPGQISFSLPDYASWLLIIVVSCIAVLFFHHFQFQSPYITSNDGFYHIKFSYLLRTEGFISTFKWADFSIWKYLFSDKDFLYHLYLIPFTYIENLEEGIKIATVILAAAVTISFFKIMELNKINGASFWFFVLMLSSTYFLFRINSPRPQSLSVLLALWTIHCIINNHRYRLALLSFLYCTAYTASFLPCIFSLIASIYRYYFADEVEWKTPLASFMGFLVGMTFHPYFPDNWHFLWIQNFYIFFLQNTDVGKVMASELHPMNTRDVIYFNALIVLTLVAAFITAMSWPQKIDIKTGIIFCISLPLLILTAHSKRFTEYSIPCSLLFAGFFFNNYLSGTNLATIKNYIFMRPKRSSSVIFFTLIVVVFSSFITVSSLAKQYDVKESQYKAAALYLSSSVPKDEVIFTCDWDDAPELWFYNSNNRYLVFLDPSFMYYMSSDLYRKWNSVAQGALGASTYNVLKNDFKIQYGVCTADYSRLYRIMRQDPKIDIVHESANVFVFRLK